MQYLGENLEVGMNVKYGSCGYEWETTIENIEWHDKDNVYYLHCLDANGSDYTTIQLTKENVSELDELLASEDYEYQGYCYEYSAKGFGRTIVNIIPNC